MYLSIEQDKNAKFLEFLNEAEKNPRVYVFDQGIDRQNDAISVRYLTMEYEGFIFIVFTCEYYPFTDDNHPGKFNFVAYERIDRAYMVQASYFVAYNGIISLDNWIESGRRISKPVCDKIPLYISVRYDDAYMIEKHVNESGGFRERSIIEQNPLFIPTCTWNGDHKVVNVISTVPNTTGRRDSFSFDLVTKKICG